MLSLSSYPAAGVRRALSACVHSDDQRGFLAKAREASRGRRRTSFNGLNGLENPSMGPVCATSRFFSSPVDTRRSQYIRTGVAVF